MESAGNALFGPAGLLDPGADSGADLGADPVAGDGSEETLEADWDAAPEASKNASVVSEPELAKPAASEEEVSEGLSVDSGCR